MRRVVTDLACFQQVLGEIVANALAHHKRAGGRIVVSGRNGEGHGPWRWRTTAAASPPEALDRVFEPLVRAGGSSERHRRAAGTAWAWRSAASWSPASAATIAPRFRAGPGDDGPRSDSPRRPPAGRADRGRGRRSGTAHGLAAAGSTQSRTVVPSPADAADRERPLVPPPDPVGDAQADAQVARLGAEERLDGPLEDLRRHAPAGVPDLEDDPAAVVDATSSRWISNALRPGGLDGLVVSWSSMVRM